MVLNAHDFGGDVDFVTAVPAEPTLLGERRITMTRIAKLSPFESDFAALIEGKRFGHMGMWEYSNGGMKLWDEFLRTHSDEYYVPIRERALINRYSNASANAIAQAMKAQGHNKITLVSRGPGTQFEAKEGSLIAAFKAAGIEIAKVVYIDHSRLALNKSESEGRRLLPKAKHETYKGDMYDPTMARKYRVEGMEVGVAFGLTLMNAEGSHTASSAPLTSVQEQFKAIAAQQSKGSHFIAAYDHNEDKAIIERAYAGQTDFAKHMLAHHLGWDADMLSSIDFDVEYNPVSRILAHAFRFQSDAEFDFAGHIRTPEAGTTWWFNNSVKLSKEQTEACHENVGYSYVFQGEKALMDDQGIMGYHHVQSNTPRAALS